MKYRLGLVLGFLYISISGFAIADSASEEPEVVSCESFLKNRGYAGLGGYSNSYIDYDLLAKVIAGKDAVGDTCKKYFVKREIKEGWPNGVDYSWHILLMSVPSVNNIQKEIDDGNADAIAAYVRDSLEFFGEYLDQSSKNQPIPHEAVLDDQGVYSFTAGYTGDFTPLEAYFLYDSTSNGEAESPDAVKLVIKEFDNVGLKMRKKVFKTITKNRTNSAKEFISSGFDMGEMMSKALKDNKFLVKSVRKSSLLSR